MRDAISAVQKDESTLKGDGLPLLSGMDDAISTGQADVSQAIFTTNNAIDQVNANLATAYQLADSAGTGNCANNGPGKAPSGLSHIS